MASFICISLITYSIRRNQVKMLVISREWKLRAKHPALSAVKYTNSNWLKRLWIFVPFQHDLTEAQVIRGTKHVSHSISEQHRRQPVYTSRYRGAYYGKKCEAGYSSWSFSYYFFANPKDSMLCFHPGRYVCDIIFKRKSKNYNAKGIAKKIEKWFPNNPLVRKSSPDGIKYAEKSRSNKLLGLSHFVRRRTSAKPHYVVL